jgi:hypothetical protein
MRCLMCGGRFVTKDNRSVLYHAARKGQLESIRLLVQRGANLHATTDVSDAAVMVKEAGCI